MEEEGCDDALAGALKHADREADDAHREHEDGGGVVGEGVAVALDDEGRGDCADHCWCGAPCEEEAQLVGREMWDLVNDDIWVHSGESEP